MRTSARGERGVAFEQGAGRKRKKGVEWGAPAEDDHKRKKGIFRDAKS